MVNPNLTAALRLASKGVAVFPCKPDKTPCDGIRWRSEATTDPRRIEAWWRRWPDAVPAYEPGKHGQLVIDCDRHGGPDGVAIFETMARDHGDDPRDWPTVQTPSTGRHISFANPARLTNSRGALPAGIDVRGSGGYVVAEGSILPDGRGYRVPDGYNGIVDALEADAMPALPEWLTEILTARRTAPEALPERLGDGPGPFVDAAWLSQQPNLSRRERMAFEAALQAETRNVASAGEGNRNGTLNTAAFNLFQMVAAGWGSSTEVETELTAAAFAAGLRQPEVAKTIASGRKGGMAKPRGKLEDRNPSSDMMTMPLTTINGITVNASTGEVIDLSDDGDDDQDDEGEAPPIDEGLTHVGGVLGEVIDWIAACGSTGNRRLALSAALPLCATLLGRRVATPTRSGGGLELYVVATMESGAGKADQRQAVIRLFDKLNLSSRHLARGFASGRALADHICNNPLSLSIIDEIADYFEQMFTGNSHLQQVQTIMKEQWGIGFSSFGTDASLTRGSSSVYTPCWSVYGMTTNEDLFRVVKTKEITSGFINRFLMIDGGTKTKQKPIMSFRDPPQRLLDNLAKLYTIGEPPREGNLGDRGLVNKNDNPDPAPYKIPWASVQAEDAFDAFEDECSTLISSDPIMGKLYARTAFMAIKLATIRAACEFSPVTVDHVEWGAMLARQSADRFHSTLKHNMVDPISYPELFRKIAGQFTSPSPRGSELMQEYGGNALPRRFLWNAMKHHTGKNVFDFSNALKAMKDNGEVDFREVQNSVTRRKTDCVIYRQMKKRNGGN